MATKPPPPPGTSTRTDAVRGLALLTVVVVALVVLFLDWGEGDPGAATPTAAPSSTAPTPSPTTAAPTSPASATPTPTTPRVPDLTGVRLDRAKQQAREHGSGDPTSHDLSPRGRGQWQDRNWTVVTTRPAAGEPWEDGVDLHLFVLRNAEWDWFRANPTMPAIPPDLATSDLTYPGGLLHDVSELVEYRYTPGHESAYGSLSQPGSTQVPIEGVTDDPSLEPVEERQERDALAEAQWYGAISVGSLPVTGTPLRVGRLLTVTVRHEPSDPIAPAPNTGGDTYVTPDSDDDDDFNVPGWLCPTRFC